MNMAAAMLQLDEGDRVRHRKDKCKSFSGIFFWIPVWINLKMVG